MIQTTPLQPDLARYYSVLDPLDKALVDNIVNPQPDKKLLDFITATDRSYQPERFHSLLCSILDDVLFGRERFVIVTAPPQHGKSSATSVNFPAMHLGLYPDIPIIISSYGADLANAMSSKVRDLVEGPEFADIFKGVETRDDSRAVNMWKIKGHKGFVRATGVGGGLTGHGSGVGIVDDFFKDEDEAYSPTMREKVWRWYNTAFQSRIWPGGKQIIIATRWHMDDLIGRIMNSPGWQKWKVVRLPAVSEEQSIRDRNNEKYHVQPGQPDPLGRRPGEPLCPIFRPLEHIYESTATYTATQFSALYQGAPGVAEGNLIKREWLESNIVDFVPFQDKGIYRIRAWDRAGTDGSRNKDADATCGVLMVYDSNTGDFYIEDVVWGQWSAAKRDEIIDQTAEDDFAKYGFEVEIWHEQEPGSSGKDTAEIADKRLSKYPVYHEVSTGSKETRGRPFIAACEREKMHLLRATWNMPFIDEVISFPTGEHDDRFDGSTLAYNKLMLKKQKRKTRVY